MRNTFGKSKKIMEKARKTNENEGSSKEGKTVEKLMKINDISRKARKQKKPWSEGGRGPRWD